MKWYEEEMSDAFEPAQAVDTAADQEGGGNGHLKRKVDAAQKPDDERDAREALLKRRTLLLGEEESDVDEHAPFGGVSSASEMPKRAEEVFQQDHGVAAPKMPVEMPVVPNTKQAKAVQMAEVKRCNMELDKGLRDATMELDSDEEKKTLLPVRPPHLCAAVRTSKKSTALEIGGVPATQVIAEGPANACSIIPETAATSSPHKVVSRFYVDPNQLKERQAERRKRSLGSHGFCGFWDGYISSPEKSPVMDTSLCFQETTLKLVYV